VNLPHAPSRAATQQHNHTADFRDSEGHFHAEITFRRKQSPQFFTMVARVFDIPTRKRAHKLITDAI
jgi:hypothetical protein